MMVIFWLVVTGTFFDDFPFSWEESSQLTNSYFSEGWLNHQPEIVHTVHTSAVWICPETMAILLGRMDDKRYLVWLSYFQMKPDGFGGHIDVDDSISVNTAILLGVLAIAQLDRWSKCLPYGMGCGSP